VTKKPKIADFWSFGKVTTEAGNIFLEIQTHFIILLNLLRRFGRRSHLFDKVRNFQTFRSLQSHLKVTAIILSHSNSWSRTKW